MEQNVNLTRYVLALFLSYHTTDPNLHTNLSASEITQV